VATARKITKFYTFMESVRLTTTITEAGLRVIRLTIAYTNTRKVSKSECHYHGSVNNRISSVIPREKNGGAADTSTVVIDSSCRPGNQQDQTIVLPFNDIQAT